LHLGGLAAVAGNAGCSRTGRGVDVEESIGESYFLLLDNFCVIV
jgi:hypothetical protein